MRWVVRGGGSSAEVEVEQKGNQFTVVCDGQRRDLELVRLDGAVASLRFPDSGRSLQISYQSGGNGNWRIGVSQREFDFDVLTPAEAVEAVSAARETGPSRVTAPIPGKVVSVKVEPGDTVEPGQSLVVLEAMKMENELAAEQAGKVSAVHVQAGDTVDGGELLVELE
ncbi:MAG: biotin/lipoyl-binding protein [Acidobacteriota bacterium]